MSIQPRWVAEILNGNKTIEVRKKFPKDYVGWVYIYCTKNGRPLVYGSPCPSYVEDSYVQTYNISKKDADKIFGSLNGKVVAKFWCDKVEEIYCQLHFNGWALETDTMSRDTLNKRSCLNDKELREYFNRGVYTFNETYGYAIHISKLEVFDKPKELWQLRKKGCAGCYLNHKKIKCNQCGIKYPCGLEKAPQSWCYVEE